MTLRHQPDRYLTRARGGTVYELNCYRCGQPGHIKANCPDAPAFPPDPPAERGDQEATYTPPRYVASHRAAHPPNAAYIEAKTRQGWGQGGDVLTVGCPWCGVNPYRPCINPGTGAPKLTSHDARFASLPGLSTGYPQLIHISAPVYPPPFLHPLTPPPQEGTLPVSDQEGAPMSLTVTGTRIYANEEYIIGRARQYAAADASIDALRVTCPGVTADAPPDMVRAAAVGGLTSVVQGLLAIIDRLTEDGQA